MKRFFAILLTIITLGCFGLSSCKKRVAVGKFYDFQDACDKGFFTEEDVKAIAYYHHDGRWLNEDKMEENYEPPIKTPAAIPANLQKEIKSDYIYYYMKETKNAKESMVKIEKYYGMYNGYYVGILYTTAPGYHHNDSIYDVEIMGYTFHYNWKKIKVWGKR